MSADRLIEAVARAKNPSLMGLDPRLELIPPSIAAKHMARGGETLEAAAEA